MYTELSQEQQIELISGLVPELLSQYSINNAEFKSINHGFNSSFKVTTEAGENFALRINTNSKKSPHEVEGEVQLLEYIAKNNIVEAPRPNRTSENFAYSKVEADFLGKEITAVLNNWIDGEELGIEATDQELFELGAQMAKLHQCAPTIPNEIVEAFPRITRTLFNSPDNLRRNDSRFDSEMRNLIDRAFEATEQVFEQLKSQSQMMLIHADLHPHNALKTNNGLAIIDFDDAGIGYALQDMSITFFYLRDNAEREEFVKQGYLSVAELPEMKQGQMDALLVARQLLLLNDLLDVTTAEEIAYTPEYIEITRLRLKNYHETGRFELIRRLS